MHLEPVPIEDGNSAFGFRSDTADAGMTGRVSDCRTDSDIYVRESCNGNVGQRRSRLVIASLEVGTGPCKHPREGDAVSLKGVLPVVRRDLEYDESLRLSGIKYTRR